MRIDTNMWTIAKDIDNMQYKFSQTQGLVSKMANDLCDFISESWLSVWNWIWSKIWRICEIRSQMSTCCFLLCNQKRSSSRVRYIFVKILRTSLKWKHLWISFEFNIHSANLDFDICSWKYPIWPNITLNFCLSSSLNHLKWVWSIFFILAITSDKVSSKFCRQKSTQRRLWWNFVFEAYMACGGSTKEPSKRLLWPRAPNSTWLWTLWFTRKRLSRQVVEVVP